MRRLALVLPHAHREQQHGEWLSAMHPRDVACLGAVPLFLLGLHYSSRAMWEQDACPRFCLRFLDRLF